MLAATSASAQEPDLAEKLRIVRQAEAERIAVFDRAAKSVVCIFADRERGGGGSGVVITEDGYGLTNFHVVAMMLETRQGFGGLSDGRLYPLQVLGVDPGGDVAMFKLSGRERFDAAPLGDSDAVRVGDWAAAMGNPFTLAEDYTPTITYGIISGVHRYQYGQGNALEYADCIQASTSINPGNSGGPLFDMAGQVIGINGRGSFEERGRVNVGLGYAIGVNQIKRFIPWLRGGQTAEHGTLGATVGMAGDDLIFEAIQDFSPIDRAGIRLGDELVSIDDRPMRTPNEYLNYLTTLPAGWPVKVTVRRRDQQVTAEMRTERIPAPLPKPLELDYPHNHAEIRRLIEPYRLPAAATAAKDEPTTAQSDPQTQVGGTDSGERAVTQFHVAVKDGAAAGASDNRLLDEWTRLAAPLATGEKVTLGWELIGGDEVSGRVVYVVERRHASGDRVRWKFDLETERLIQAALGTEEPPESTLWTATDADRRAIWPTEWLRMGVSSDPIAVTVTPTADAAADSELASADPAFDIRHSPFTLPPSFDEAIAAATTRVVKLYGASIGRQAGYGSGVLVSPDGRIITTQSLMLEGRSLRAVLHDGREFPAEVLARDDRRELALLKIDAADLPFFEVGASEHLKRGDWLIAASNAFKVAQGREPVSVWAGVLTARTDLDARRRTQPYPYGGPVLLLDMIAANPGAAGGAVVDVDGRLVGVVGNRVIGELTNTWLNYAMPVEEIAAFIAAYDAPAAAAGSPERQHSPTDPASADSAPSGEEEVAGQPYLGIRLFEIGGRLKPAYVERVRPGSPAHRAGVRRNDLIVALNGRTIGTCDDYHDLFVALHPGQEVEIVVKRKEELKTFRIEVGGK